MNKHTDPWFEKIVLDIETNWGVKANQTIRDSGEEEFYDLEVERENRIEARHIIPAACRQLYQAISEKLPATNPRPIIAGGFARSFLLGELPNDVDIFVDVSEWQTNEDFSIEDLIDIFVGDLSQTLKTNVIESKANYIDSANPRGFSVFNFELPGSFVLSQIIFRKDGSAKTVESLFDSFNHSLTLAYYDPENDVVVYHDKYLESLEKKVVEVYCDKPNTIGKVETICKTFLYDVWKGTLLHGFKAKKCYKKEKTEEDSPAQSAPLLTHSNKTQEQVTGSASPADTLPDLWIRDTKTGIYTRKNLLWIN